MTLGLLGAQRRARTTRLGRHKGNILLADDDRVARKALSYVLGREGHRVADVSDGAELFDHIDRCFTHRLPLPDLIVSDVCMPNLGGLDVAQGLHLAALSIPVILITGCRGDELPALAGKLAPFAIIEKPLLVSELLRTVEKALARHDA